jgi:transposase
MYLKKMANRKTGRTYLSIAHGYRDKAKGYSTNVTVRKLGYLDELEKEYPDPIAHFTQVAREMTEQAESENRVEAVTLDLNETLPQDSDGRHNLGYAAIVKVFHELGLDRYFRNRQRGRGFEYNTYSIMLLLVVSRLLSPASKKRTFDDKGLYFERFDFELHDVYRSLGYYAGLANETQRHMHERIREQYGRDTELVYYDVTNYYFEVEEPDGDELDAEGNILARGLRKKGASKEHRPDPIVQMGLAMDADGLPIAYKLYPGNNNDVTTLRPMLRELKTEYALGRVIVVADRGLNSGDNIFYMTTDNDKDGYVLSISVRGGSKEFKRYVLDDTGYRYGSKQMPGGCVEADATFKIKSRVERREIRVTRARGGKMDKPVDEKQVIFYSKKYADRAKADRADAVAKARDLCGSPSKYNRATSYGAAKYVRNLEYDKTTGEILTDNGHAPVFNEQKLKEEELYDGYYAIVTSELDRTDNWIIDTYRGLWKIEESFRITKSELETRPVYVSREDHIQAHFLSCFIALVILRLLQKKTGGLFSAGQILECLNRIECRNEHENIYLFDFRNDIADAIGNAIGVDFSKRRLRLADIKNILASCKI